MIRAYYSYEVERKYDSLTITEKDGTALAHYDGWEVSDDDWRDEIVSKTDMVTVRFRTDSSGSGFRGWRLHWGEFNILIQSMLSCSPPASSKLCKFIYFS